MRHGICGLIALREYVFHVRELGGLDVRSNWHPWRITHQCKDEHRVAWEFADHSRLYVPICAYFAGIML